ncbi:hypothetical protein BN1723_003899 [Verticillium longisporum]|uniref:Uncharacterized protein n=1 Tax=Verticillium longisporum TaxID=100787 RepID=A0A0G4MG45_VERLO|nr:hypothetical protein BN1723_003899 [Verticillium longisporum]
MVRLNSAVLVLSSVAANVLANATIPKHETCCPVFINATNAPLDCDPSRTVSFIDYPLPLLQSVNGSDIDTEALEYAFEALTVMQSDFFMPAQGTWPEAIDWTVAVMETMLSGMLTTLSRAFSAIDFLRKDDKGSERNLIDSYFTQLVASYFGQDDVAIRHQAYDDILWVVLGWVDAIKFVHVHSTLHYPPRDPSSIVNEDLGDALRKSPWYGHFWQERKDRRCARRVARRGHCCYPAGIVVQPTASVGGYPTMAGQAYGVRRVSAPRRQEAEGQERGLTDGDVPPPYEQEDTRQALDEKNGRL